MVQNMLGHCAVSASFPAFGLHLTWPPACMECHGKGVCHAARSSSHGLLCKSCSTHVLYCAKFCQTLLLHCLWHNNTCKPVCTCIDLVQYQGLWSPGPCLDKSPMAPINAEKIDPVTWPVCPLVVVFFLHTDSPVPGSLVVATPTVREQSELHSGTTLSSSITGFDLFGNPGCLCFARSCGAGHT